MDLQLIDVSNTCNWSDTTPPIDPHTVKYIVQYLATVVSALSLLCDIGLFIHFFYEATEKSSGNRKRLVAISIACISLADFISSLSHIQGLWSTFKHESLTRGQYIQVGAGCGAQATLTTFGTLASFLWIDVLIFVTVTRGTKRKYLACMNSRAGLLICQAICWGAPLFVAVGLASGKVMGYREGVDIGKLYCMLHFTS